MKKILVRAICVLLFATGNMAGAQIVFTNYTTASGLPDDYISGGVAVDTNNHVWFGTAAGVAEFDGSTWTVYDTTDGVIDMFIKCIAVDNHNNIWVGTAAGVSKFDGTTWSSYDMFDGLIDNDVSYIACDTNDVMWFVTYIGVSKFDGTNWHNYTTLDGLSSDAVNFVIVDSLNNKWFGTIGGGMSKYDNTSFTNFNTTDSLQDNNVFTVAFDHQYHKWIGTWYGISELDNNDAWVANYDTVDMMFNNYVRDIDVDQKNNVWIGMFADYNQEGAITMYDHNIMTTYTVTDGLVDKQVIRLAVDHDNCVWVATGLGVSRICDFTGIDSKEPALSFALFPNPVNTSVNIFSNEHAAAQLTITNMLGEKIYMTQLTENIAVNTSEWPAGLYTVQYGSTVEKIMVCH